MSKCKCFEDIRDRLEKKVNDDLPKGATDLHVQWVNRGFLLTDRDLSPINPRIAIEYRELKRNGEPSVKLTKAENVILAEYCCFCGRKYAK